MLQGKEAAGDLAKHMQTLSIFAYGNLQEYTAKKAKCIDLNAKMMQKLRILSFVDMASREPTLSYADIAKNCNLSCKDEETLKTEVESLVLEAYQH